MESLFSVKNLLLSQLSPCPMEYPHDRLVRITYAIHVETFFEPVLIALLTLTGVIADRKRFIAGLCASGAQDVVESFCDLFVQRVKRPPHFKSSFVKL